MITSLFHQCYYSFLRGNLSEAEMYYQFIKEEYSLRKDPTVLKPRQLKALKVVRDAIKAKSIQECSWVPDTDTQANIAPEKAYDETQVELLKQIHTGEAQLTDLTLPHGNLYLFNIEHPTPPYGAVDMVYMDDVFVYPTEVKIGCGKHDIIGQIMKYDLFFKLNLHLGFWEGVRPITICSHYQDFTLIELKKRGVITLRHETKNDGIRLSKV